MARPLVSIAIPTWNRRSMLRVALESAQAQTYDNLEIVVSDNASNDGSAEMVREMAREDDRIRLYVNDRNIGTHNYLKVSTYLRGDYVKFLNDDDLLLPHAVERLAAPLEDPSVGLSIARQEWMSESGRPLTKLELKPDFKWWMDYSYLGNESTLLEGFDLGNYSMVNTINAFGVPSVHMFRRSEYSLVTDGWMAGRRFTAVGDVGYCLQLAAGRKVAYIAESSVMLRMHDGQETAKPEIRAINAMEWLHLIEHTKDLGYLADKRERIKAVQKVAFLLANQLECGGTGENVRRVAEGLAHAAEVLRELGEPVLPVQSRDGRLVATPDWSSPRPVRDLLERWARDAHRMPEHELALLVDPNLLDVDAVAGTVTDMLLELGLDPDTVPDISIEASRPSLI
jgi:glycosyltransferase involved in cell wall biosynthesis